MERVKMVLSGLAILSLLFAFGVPVAHAQNFEIDGKGQLQTTIYTHDVQHVKAKGKGYVMLSENGLASECDGLGYSYDIVVIENPDEEGVACDTFLLGYLDTCSGEQSAVATLAVDEIPDGTTNYALCYFNGPVKNGAKFDSKGGECDLYDAGDTWIGISKNAGFKLKEKNLENKIKCTMP